MRDYFKLLGVTELAKTAEIKKAYRTKAKQFHPDANPNDPKAAERFIELREAYEMAMAERIGVYPQRTGTAKSKPTMSPGEWAKQKGELEVFRFLTNLEQVCLSSGGSLGNPETEKMVKSFLAGAWNEDLIIKINKYASRTQKERIIELNFYLYQQLDLKLIQVNKKHLERIARSDAGLLTMVRKNRNNAVAENIIYTICAVIIVIVILSLFLAVTFSNELRFFWHTN